MKHKDPAQGRNARGHGLSQTAVGERRGVQRRKENMLVCPRNCKKISVIHKKLCAHAHTYNYIFSDTSFWS